jgi:hypothetical protein
VNHAQPICLEQLTPEVIPNLRLDQSGQLVNFSSFEIGSTSSLRKLPLRAIAHLKTVIYWLQDYHPSESASNLDRVRGYLEACYHLCELSAWNLAYSLLKTPLPTPNSRPPTPLYKQLELWGYYQELTDLWRSLLGRLDPADECFCLNQLGQVCYFRGRFVESVSYYEQALAIAQEIQDAIAQIRALLGLSNFDTNAAGLNACLGNSQTALKLAYAMNHAELQAEALYQLAGLLCVNCIEAKRQKQALNYALQGLALAQATQQFTLECKLYGMLGNIYCRLGNAAAGVHSMQQQLTLAQTHHNPREQWVALVNLGTHFLYSDDWEQGQPLMQQAIEVARRLQIPYYQTFIFRNQLALNLKKAAPAPDLEPLQEALSLARRDNYRYLEWILLMAIAASLLQRQDLSPAQPYLQQAEAIVQSGEITGTLIAFDFVTFSYLLSRAGHWRSGLRYAKRTLVLARRYQLSQERFWGILVVAYAYWQGQRRLTTLLILLKHVPVVLAVASRDPSICYSLSMAVENIVLQPLASLRQSFRHWFQLQPGNQQSD